MAKLIKVHNKTVNVDAISYVEFLDSGRAMIFMGGLSQEKQNITVDPDEARKLRMALDALMAAN